MPSEHIEIVRLGPDPFGRGEMTVFYRDKTIENGAEEFYCWLENWREDYPQPTAMQLSQGYEMAKKLATKATERNVQDERIPNKFTNGEHQQMATTVGELKAILGELPDDLFVGREFHPLVVYVTNNGKNAPTDPFLMIEESIEEVGA